MGRRNHSSSWYSRCPNHLVENGAESGKNGTFFGFLVGAPRVLEWGVISSSGIVAKTQNYKRAQVFFEIPPTGRVLWPSLQAFWVPPAKRRDFWGTALQKKPHQKYLRCFFGCKIQCRLWFFYQNWSSSMVSLSYGRLKLTGQNGQKGTIIP